MMTTRFCLEAFIVAASSLALGVRADAITAWNSAALNAIRARNSPPPAAARNLAILHTAIYDAVNGISRTHESYFVLSTVPASASKEAAASAAAHKVLLNLYPATAAIFDALHGRTLAAISEGPQKAAGIAWGEGVAEQILALRANDGSDATVAPPSGSGPGIWQPTPPANAAYLLPQWGFVTPFVMADPAQFRPPGPPALSSAQWAANCNEVKALGRATDSTRTEEQSQIALFWVDGAGTETPPGHWNSIAREVAATLSNTLEENARLFALLNLALADATICAWDAKYTFNFWRPVTAIRNGDTDGNPATDADPSWLSYITTPPFPDYVSGHSTFSGAASTVLALFYGTDNISFTTGSDSLPGVLRSFDSFSAAAEEAAISRLYGGIHFRFANEDGLQSGLRIGEFTFQHSLQPKGNRSRK
ncbi:MAG: vanadium-dependent haloperoxidase [Acidobacteria bacterium]|nr:vanadium-dependent haloperoxidase [Acidobacteriota bacterium]